MRGSSRAGGLAALLALGVLAVPSVARADAVDLWWLMTRAGGWEESPALAALVAVGLMGINYALNLIVLGIPARRSIALVGRSVRVEVALLSLAAQVVDRIGCVGGLVFGLIGASLFVTGERGLVAGLFAGLALNFVFSGLGLFALVRRFDRHRWHLDSGLGKRLAIRAAIVTNPGWLMLAMFLPQAGG